jgi:hypothetical protein
MIPVTNNVIRVDSRFSAQEMPRKTVSRILTKDSRWLQICKYLSERGAG